MLKHLHNIRDFDPTKTNIDTLSFENRYELFLIRVEEIREELSEQRKPKIIETRWVPGNAKWNPFVE